MDQFLLMTKLKMLGFRGQLGNWLGNFMTDRLQAVKVGGGLSSWERVISGIPQGLVLGPLLLLVFICDLGEELRESARATLLKYVDDTKVIRGVSSLEEVEKLQEELNLLFNWQQLNNMQ